MVRGRARAITAVGALAQGLRMGHSLRVVWVLLATDLLFFTYGCLNLVTPRTTRGWQIQWTARHSNDPLDVGRSFQRFVRDDPTKPPDHAVLRRIRIIGIAEIVLSLIIAVVVVAASS
jgi:hypothetical protein